MSLLDKFFNNLGTRFRVYFVYENEARYVLKGNSVLRMLGYLEDYFKNGKMPIEGWILYFSSGATQRNFALDTSHFVDLGLGDGGELYEALDAMDERWRYINGPKLEFQNCLTKKDMPIQSFDLKSLNFKSDDVSEILKQIDSREEDLLIVLDRIFGR